MTRASELIRHGLEYSLTLLVSDFRDEEITQSLFSWLDLRDLTLALSRECFTEATGFTEMLESFSSTCFAGLLGTFCNFVFKTSMLLYLHAYLAMIA